MLKGSLAPGHINAEVFGDFGHQPMPHSVVVDAKADLQTQKG